MSSKMVGREKQGHEGLGEEQAAQVGLLRGLLLIVTSAGGVMLAAFVIVVLVNPQFPVRYPISFFGAALVLSLFSLWLLRRGRPSLASGIYLLGTTLLLFVAMYLLNGTMGPFAVALIIVPTLAALLISRTATRATVAAISASYLLMVLLEAAGVLRPLTAPQPILRGFYSGIFIFTFAVIAFLVAHSARLMRRALAATQQREQEAAAAGLQAEQAAQAERLGREREARAARQLRAAVRDYSDFLQRVSAGDYSARLELGPGAQGQEGGEELLALGQQLNATVETLVRAVTDMQIVQRRYAHEAWAGVGAAGTMPRGFRYRAGEVELSDEAWLTPMTEAVKTSQAVADEHELALPITLRGEVIGAVAARRDQAGGWSGEEIQVAETIASQLAQTIESLRLLDETQHRAARERIIREIADQMQRATDMQTLMRITAEQLNQALGGSRAYVRLGTQAALHSVDGNGPPDEGDDGDKGVDR